MTTDRDWETIGWVQSSQYREDVLEALTASPKTPSTIAEQTDDGIAHISRALRSLRERDLVELLVSEDCRKGRVYGLTDAGAKIAGEMQEVSV
ncbi:hypothetical protein SAMN06269185_3311 [Natronoarchaeum philippinense]|uniref:HVO-A0261-like N-terminal domain-containing protein n=1 Tax=Natronoarchaeum philippinense TaxID=558529 RepID=A0A285P9Z8_NATPI|nr:winged helix-turn-helix domain-containing protein [Natronoarchaeum philippinense]SNZ18258.1 hypothetical protein SAMN06269185_3311 [Natronoarchaeum philippinense]